MKVFWDFMTYFFVALLSVTASATQISFDLSASYPHSAQKKCLSYWLNKGTHVTAQFKTPAASGQKVNFEIFDNSFNGNQYGTKNDFSDQTLVFTPQENSEVFFCFWNVLDDGLVPSPSYVRQVGLQIQIGKTDEDYQKLAKAEKLKPHELTLKQFQERFSHIIEVMDMFKKQGY